MTTVTTENRKTPYVVLQRLRLQDVAGLKLKSEYKTIIQSSSTKGTKNNNVKEGRRLRSSAKRTNDSSVKEGRWLKEQNETTSGEITAREDGAKGATKDGESCLPAGEEGSKEHHCFRCSMNFPNSDTLVLHLKSHGPVRRSCTLYEKEVCGTSIDDSGPQNRRMMTSTKMQKESSSHSGGSRFPCNVCDKVFMQGNHLKLHMRIHTESKTAKEQGADSVEISSPLDQTAFIKMMKNVIEETAIKCFSDALETNTLPSSSDEAVDRVRVRARKALEQYCNSSSLVDLKQQGIDDLERILQNLENDSLDIKQEDDDDSNGGESDKNVVSVNSHNESFSVPNSLPNHQANIKSNMENEGSAGVSEYNSASDKHTEYIQAASVTDNVSSSVQNVIQSKKFTEETRNVQESKKFTENVKNVLENKICTPHKTSVPDTEKGVATKVNSSKKHSPIRSVPPREPGQSNTHTGKTSERRRKTMLTTYQELMVRRSKKLFPCHICHKVFTLQSHLKLHQGKAHGTEQSKQNIGDNFSENTDPQEGEEDEEEEGDEEDDDIAEEKQLYRCDIERCSKLFSREQDLNAHQKEAHFTCLVCDKVFPEEHILKRHEKNHSEVLLFNCTKCEKAYQLNEDLLLHISRAHPATKHSPENKIIKDTLFISPHSYKCRKCNIQFSDSNTYELHLKSDHTHVPISGIHTTLISTSDSHTGVFLHICVKCNLQFPNGTALEHHLHTCTSSVVKKEKTLDCSNCSIKFPDDISLEHHMKLSHSKLILKCPRCDLKFPSGNALQSHMKHHGSRSPIRTPSKCSKCQLKFSNDALLERHMKLRHSLFQNVNQHLCSKCGMKFDNQASLNHHTKLNHSPELEEAKKVLACSTCGMKFSDGSSFHSHMKHHTSVVQKSIESCDGTMSQNDIVKLSEPDAQANSIQRDKLQNISTSMNNTGTTVECSQSDLHFSDINLLQPHVKLYHASEFGSQYSEVNHTQLNSAKNLQPSPVAQKKLISVTKGAESNPVPVREISQTCSQLSESCFECSECNIQFSDFDSLQTHMKLNHTPSLQNPKLKVTETSVTESKEASVLNAVPSSNPTSTVTYPRGKRTEIVFECSKCFRIFKGNDGLQNHMKMQHSPMPESTNILKCLRCHKQFPTSSEFRSHLRTHRRKYCPQCGKSFTTQNGLGKHMCVHASQLAYKCDTCCSQFSSSDLFKKHLKWHDEDAHLAIQDRRNIQKQTETGNPPQSAAAAESFQNASDSSHIINNMKHFGVDSDETETTSQDHLDENLVTIDDDDDDVIILSDEENIVNEESHNTGEVELGTDDEIMMVLDNTRPDVFEEWSDKRVKSRTSEISIGVQTEVLPSQESASSFVTYSGNTVSTGVNTAGDIRSFKAVPLVSEGPVSENDSFERHEDNDHSGDTGRAENVKSTVLSRKLSSSVGRCKSPDTSSTVCNINESTSDTRDSVQLENNKIVKTSPRASPKSSNRKRILKAGSQFVGPQQKKRKMLRVSFADVSDRGSDTSTYSENRERTMPKQLPEKLIVDSIKGIASQNLAQYPSQFKNDSVSPTKLEDGILGSNVNKITTASNKTSSEELCKSREYTGNRFCGGKEINDKDELQKFNENLKTDDQNLSLPPKAKNITTSKESNKLGTRTLLHYFHYENVVSSSCEQKNDQIMNMSSPVAKSTPLPTKKITHIRTTDSAVHSAKEENLPEKENSPAENMGPRKKLGASDNTIPPHSENRNRTSASLKKEKLGPKRFRYVQKRKYSRLRQGRFKCKICGKVFHSVHYFRVHKKIHNGPLIYKCPICTNRFPLRFLLGLHVADHFQKGIPRMISENEMPSLNNSTSSTSKNIAPIFHIPKKKTASTTQDNNAETETSSSHCSNPSATTVEQPTNQNNSLVENKLLQSESIKDHSSTQTIFDNSNESIGGYSPHKQHLKCDGSIGYSSSSENKKIVEYSCEKCGQMFSGLLKLKLHQSTHTGVGLYKCSYCDLMFHFKQSLLSHADSHSGEKKFACKYCGRRFEEYSVMVRHRSTHEDGKRPFKCPDCPRTFALDSTLRTHMQLHIRRSLYRCTFCNCFFGVKAHFQNHIVIHTGKKPFLCKICKFAFNREGACRKHISLVHIAKNEIALDSTQTLMDYVQIDKEIYKELQDFIKDIISKTRLGGEEKSEMKSMEVSAVPIDKELPEPILVDRRRLQVSFGKEICKAKANITLSDIYSADMNKKERYEKLCVEVRNVLTRMKRYSQVPIMSPSRNQSHLKTSAKQIRDPRLRKSLNLYENKSLNNFEETSKSKHETNGNINKSADQTHSPKGSIVQKSSKKSAIVEKKHKKTMQVYKDVIASSIGKRCKYCGELFTERYLKTHELTHTGQADHLCSFCDKAFTSKTGLMYHLALHADVRPYPCTVCGRAFKLKHQMYSHVRTHTNEKNHKCKVCSKSFFSKGNLNVHILTHIPKEEWPFKCDLCDQRFPTKWRLSHHTLRHSKVQPYECHVCYRKFTDKGSADRHVRSQHMGRNHLSKGISQTDEHVIA